MATTVVTATFNDLASVEAQFSKHSGESAAVLVEPLHRTTRPAQDFLAELARVTHDAGALLIYRAAWTRDNGAARVTREAAMAKLYATDSAQQIIDEAVQLLGARGVVAGSTAEKLLREVRALRIYEGTSEIQKLVIAGQVISAREREESPP